MRQEIHKTRRSTRQDMHLTVAKNKLIRSNNEQLSPNISPAIEENTPRAMVKLSTFGWPFLCDDD
jgi:hypothetical protein